MDKLEKAIVKVSKKFPRAKIRILRLAVSTTERAQQDISMLIQDVLERGANTFVQEATRASRNDGTRQCTYANRVSKLDSLIEKANTYERSISSSFEKMKRKLKKARRLVIQLRLQERYA